MNQRLPTVPRRREHMDRHVSSSPLSPQACLTDSQSPPPSQPYLRPPLAPDARPSRRPHRAPPHALDQQRLAELELDDEQPRAHARHANLQRARASRRGRDRTCQHGHQRRERAGHGRGATRGRGRLLGAAGWYRRRHCDGAEGDPPSELTANSANVALVGGAPTSVAA